MRSTALRALVVSIVAAAFLGAGPQAGAAGVLTAQPPMIVLAAGAPAGSSVLAIINSGESIGDFMFSGVPDGIGLMPGEEAGTVDVFVNHEESHVPFQGLADFQDSSVSELTLDTATGGVLDASVAIDPSLGYLRFCSATMAGPNEGLDRYLFFTNEETNDIVPVPAGAPYGADPGTAPNRQGGYSVVLDPATGESHLIASAGRANKENDVVIPGGWDQIAVLTDDDTFFTPPFPDWSQLFLYLADDEDQLLSDHGSLWAFQVTRDEDGKVDPADPFNGANDYGDIVAGDHWAGRFIRVPSMIARGQTAATPQDALEDWANANNVFQFIRTEDIAYDVNHPRVVYLADTGDRRMIPDAATGRLTRGSSSTVGSYPNGRIYRLEFAADNPRRVVDFSILLNADAGGLNNVNAMHQPDNLGTSAHSLMVQEDTAQAPGSRVWRYDFATQTLTVVATVNNGTVNESSGIVDASAFFGAGAWLLNVQGHDVNVESEPGPPGVTLKRESGQLLLLRLPGS
jgi:hypothetical protein